MNTARTLLPRGGRPNDGLPTEPRANGRPGRRDGGHARPGRPSEERWTSPFRYTDVDLGRRSGNPARRAAGRGGEKWGGIPDESGCGLDEGDHVAHGGPVTMPSEPELPWLQPTAELPPQPADRRRLVVLMLPVLGLLVLCCGGGLLVTSAFRGGSHKSGAPQFSVPSSSALSSPTVSPSPTASPDPTRTAPATVKVSATARPTTHRPAPTSARPTTSKPQPSGSPGGVQQNVRQGAFCAPPGAIGVTKRGRVLRCGPGPDDPRDRWRPIF